MMVLAGPQVARTSTRKNALLWVQGANTLYGFLHHGYIFKTWMEQYIFALLPFHRLFLRFQKKWQMLMTVWCRQGAMEVALLSAVCICNWQDRPHGGRNPLHANGASYPHQNSTKHLILLFTLSLCNLLVRMGRLYMHGTRYWIRTCIRSGCFAGRKIKLLFHMLDMYGTKCHLLFPFL